jgi:hypothetical protein
MIRGRGQDFGLGWVQMYAVGGSMCLDEGDKPCQVFVGEKI